jgi:hypothetical protein
MSTAAATTTTTTTTTGAAGLEGEELLACMVGSWTLDTDAFEARLQAHLDPQADDIFVDVTSGVGDLVVRADRTFSVSYDNLTIRLGFPANVRGTPVVQEEAVVVSGRVAADFEIQGDEFLPGKVEDPVLVIGQAIPPEGDFRELPPAFRYGSLRMGTRANHPYYLEKITIGCDEDRLVVNDEVRIDLLTGDGPSTIWLRVEP